jgi:hypothetical protein
MGRMLRPLSDFLATHLEQARYQHRPCGAENNAGIAFPNSGDITLNYFLLLNLPFVFLVGVAFQTSSEQECFR